MYRIGILFNSVPAHSLHTGPVTSLLQEVDERTGSVRGGEPLTLVPFVRTNDEAAFSLGAAGSVYSVEAATWCEGGVVFCSLQALASSKHVPRQPALDFERGLETIFSLSHVAVIVCASSAEFDAVASLAGPFQNTWALIGLISVEDDQRRFFEINPNLAPVSAADWFLKTKKRWQTAKPDLQALPVTKRASLGLLFPWLVTAIIRRRFENVKRRPRSEAERCREGMGLAESAMEKLHAADQRLLIENLRLLCPFFARHDDVGRYYSNVFRTTCLLVPLLIAAATVLAVAAVIDVGRHDLWHILEGVLLLIAAWLVARSKLSGHHAKWVEHRLTTELMRSSALCNLLHTVPGLALPTEEPDRWVRQTQVFWTYLRSLPALSFSTQRADLLSARLSAVADYANYQERFHIDFADQHYRAQKWLVKISGRAFVVTLCLVVAQLVIAHLSQPRDGLAVKLMMATLIFASGAFVVSLLAHQLGFEAIAERSANAAVHFRSLRTAMDQAAHSAEARQVYVWAHECAHFVLAEQHSWYRHIPLLRLDV